MASSQYLVWLDLEMTGLDPEKHHIVEIATVITNSSLEPLEKGPNIVIHQPEEVLETMHPWSEEHHRESGLLADIKQSKMSVADAEDETLRFLENFIQPQTAPLCGNSIGQDRRFLYKYMPKLSEFLHYRSIDVSSIKELVRRWYPERMRPPEKDNEHRALADVYESIRELRWYQKHIFDNEKMR